MVADAAPAGLVADPRALDGLRQGARSQSPEALREAARQFESLLAQMMIRSMRSASLGDGLFDSEQSDLYQDMFDQQISVELTRGEGLGLADLLLRQLAGAGAVAGGGAVQPAAAVGAGAVVTATSRTATAGTAPGAREAGRREFVTALWPHAAVVAHRLGVDPATIVSHAALETGWGRSLPVGQDGTPTYNLFGIKAGQRWGGGAVEAATVEFEAGAATTRRERFRAYRSLEEGLQDYAELIGRSPRYAAARNAGADAAAYGVALQRGGYATDPAYAEKLAGVARSVQAIAAGAGLKTGGGPPIPSSGRVT